MIASHQRSCKREQSIYDLAHYLPLLEHKGRAIFQAKPLLNNAPDVFVAWLKKKKETEDLKPKELVNNIRKGLEIGYEAVMHGGIALYASLPSTQQTYDTPYAWAGNHSTRQSSFQTHRNPQAHSYINSEPDTLCRSSY